MQFYDTVVLDGVRKTRDGYLVASAKTARTGIQTYTAGELGLSDRAPTDVIRVYRSPEEVFSKDALASMAHRPVTVDHPSEMVDASNWKKHSVGMTGDEVARDGEFVRIPLTLMDQAAIVAWEGGRKELSWGYTCDLDFTDGVTPQGEAYDAIQRGIRANHLATCRNARGGSELRFGDDNPNHGGQDMALKTIIVDGLPVETTDAGEAAVNKLRGMLDIAGKALTDANTAHAAAIAAKDAELGTKDATIADLQKQVVTGAALDALVADRAAVTAKAKAIAPTLDAAGKTNAEIKRAAVAAKIGDDKVTDKSDDYVGALFDHLAADTGEADPVRDAIRDNVHNVNDATKVVTDARAAYLADLHGEKAAA